MLKPKKGNSLPARGTVIFASMNAAMIEIGLQQGIRIQKTPLSCFDSF